MTLSMAQGTSDSLFRADFDRHDWESTIIGGQASWPSHLKFVVEIIFESAQPMFVAWGPDHTLLFNEAFTHILGDKWREALGRSLPGLWAGARTHLEEFFRAASEGKSTVSRDRLVPTWASGYTESRYFSYAYSPIRTAGEMQGTLCVCTDVTEAVQARRQVRHERDALLRAFEQAPGFIAITEGTEHHFTFVNAAYRHLVGERDLVGQTVAQALPEAAEQGFVSLLDTVFATGEAIIGNTAPIRLVTSTREEETRFVDFVYAPRFGADGKICGIFCEGQDVTERVHSHSQIRDLQTELIHSSRRSAMDIMASTLAHELNQPLTAIINYASAAKRFIRSNSVEEAAACLEPLISSAMRAGNIIRGARNMVEQRSVPSASFCLEDAIEEAHRLCLAADGCEYSSDLERNLTVAGDRVQIQQVIFNVLQNACQAAKSGSAPAIRVRARSHGPSIITSVSDNGPGIATAPIESIFQPFSSSKAYGMGLGLSISRTIVEAHGGRIWAENDSDGGASVHFELPRPVCQEKK